MYCPLYDPWIISSGNLDYVVSFLRSTLIEMDGLRYRMKWKDMFLDYVNRKQKHPQRGGGGKVLLF